MTSFMGRCSLEPLPGEAPLTAILTTSESTLLEVPNLSKPPSPAASLSSSSSSSVLETKPPKSPGAEQAPKQGKFVQIKEAAAHKREKLVQHVQPKVASMQKILVAQTGEFSERVVPLMSSARKRVDPTLTRINAFLRKLILDINEQVMVSGDWLNQKLPDKVVTWFAPIPPDEKEPFTIRKPSGLSLLFFILNLAVFAVGFIMFLVGVTALTSPRMLNYLTNFDPTGRLETFDISGLLANFTFTIILIGVFSLGLGYLGSIGCILGQRQMLRAYATIVSLAIASQAAFVIIIFSFRRDIQSNFAATLKADIKQKYDGMLNSTNTFSQMVDLGHVFFQCCGVNSYRDFEGSPWYQAANKLGPGTQQADRNTAVVLFPLSCCAIAGNVVTEDNLLDKDCQKKPPSVQNPHTAKPCLKAAYDWFFDHLFVFLSALITFVGLEVSAVTNALAIVTSVNKEFAKRRKKRRREGRGKDQTHIGEKEGAPGDVKTVTTTVSAHSKAPLPTPPSSVFVTEQSAANAPQARPSVSDRLDPDRKHVQPVSPSSSKDSIRTAEPPKATGSAPVLATRTGSVTSGISETRKSQTDVQGSTSMCLESDPNTGPAAGSSRPVIDQQGAGPAQVEDDDQTAARILWAWYVDPFDNSARDPPGQEEAGRSSAPPPAERDEAGRSSQ